MEVPPRYEFDKSVPRGEFHCCECPNHSCNVKRHNNIKIEEQEPEVETKKSESFVAPGANNFSYPLVWIPPGFTMNKELPRKLENAANGQQVLPYVKNPQVHKRSVDTEAQNGEGFAPCGKPHQIALVEDHPNQRYGWFPLDMNSISQLMGGGKTRKSHDQDDRSKEVKKAPDVEKEDQNKQVSYPIIWMPFDGLLKDHPKGLAENTSGGSTAEDSSSTFNVVPRKIEHLQNEEEKGKITSGDDGGKKGPVASEKKSNVKTIPVKQLEDSVPKSSKKEEEHKVGEAQVGKAKPSSPTKKSKLPPICLRVDPPRKKNGNGSSRSPSPPGDKKRQASEELKVGDVSNQLPKEIKVKDVEEKAPIQNNAEVSHTVGEAGSVEGKNTVQQTDSHKAKDTKSSDDISQAQEPQAAKETESQQGSKRERKVMSEVEAAVTIQSAYRGYDVRKSEPLKKLKQIAEVSEGVSLVKRKIEDLESRKAVDDKEKAVIGEMIMGLLLKLDSIQGMHESIRDVRRSVAKELIILQEKLDSIMSQKFAPLTLNTATAEVDDKNSKCPAFQEGFENNETLSKVSSPNDYRIAKVSEREEIGSCQLPLCHYEECDSEKKEIIESLPVNMDSQNLQDDMVVSESLASIDEDVAASCLGSEMKETVLDPSEIVQEHSQMESEKSVIHASPVDETTEQIYITSENEDQEAELLSELPRDVVEESPVTVDSDGNVEVQVQNDLVSANKDQEDRLSLEPPQDIKEGSLADVSGVRETVMQTDVVAGDEVEETYNHLLRESTEEDGKERSPPIEHDCSCFEIISPSEEQPHDDHLDYSKLTLPSEELSRDAANDDGKELAEDETSKISIKDQEPDHLQKSLGVGDKDIVLIEHENHAPLEKSSEETMSNPEFGSTSDPTNIEISVIEDGASERLPDSADDEEASVAKTTVQLDKKSEIPPLKVYEVVKQSEEAGSVECFTDTIPLTDPESDHSNTIEPLSSENQTSSETLNPELAVSESNVLESKEENVTVGRSMEDHDSVVATKNEVQIDENVVKENERLRELLEKLLASGKQQQEDISNLNGKLKNLEKKLAKTKKAKSAKHPRVKLSRPTCGKSASGSPRERPMGMVS